MRIRLEYPVKTALRFKEHWPVTVMDVKLEWQMQGDEPIGLVASCAMSALDKPPSVQPRGAAGAAALVDLGFVSRQDEMERIGRTVQGLVSLFGSIDVDFDQCKVRWEPETDEERELLKLSEFTRNTEKIDLWQPRTMSYDLIARAMASADHALGQEVTLAFLRRGRREFHAGNFIQAFYNFFFFLETQYAAGYSNQRQVIKALIETQPLRQALTRLRSYTGDEKITGECAKLFAIGDRALIAHLVKTRGNLHHHAQRGPNVWHPDKSDSVVAEADALQLIVHDIASHEAMAAMYADDKNTRMMEAAKADGATTCVIVVGSGIRRTGERVKLQPIRVTMPGRVIDRAKIQFVHQQIRATKTFNDATVEMAEYSIRSEDGRQLFAEWQRVGGIAAS